MRPEATITSDILFIKCQGKLVFIIESQGILKRDVCGNHEYRIEKNILQVSYCRFNVGSNTIRSLIIISCPLKCALSRLEIHRLIYNATDLIFLGRNYNFCL